MLTTLFILSLPSFSTRPLNRASYEAKLEAAEFSPRKLEGELEKERKSWREKSEAREAELRAEYLAEVNILKEKQQELLDKARRDRKTEEEAAKKEAKEEKKKQKEEAEEERRKMEETIRRAERKAKDAKDEAKGLKVKL